MSNRPSHDEDSLLAYFKLSILHDPPPHPDDDRSTDLIRVAAVEFARTVLGEAPYSRQRAVALTKLEESVMWAIKSIALQPPPKDRP